MYVCMYVRTYVCTYICIYVCMYAFMYVDIYVHMYVCTHVCMYICVLYRADICIHAYVHADSDYTLYPFSTQNAQDFKNLLSVYTDAVFFPKLREMDFRCV